MYITDFSCISPQSTQESPPFSNGVVSYSGNRYLALEPGYQQFIPAGLLRRMGKAVRMGVGTGLPLIKKYPELGGIILSTANGGLEDCLRFLNQIVEYEEGTLTPTNFVQSTPNAVAGNLAMLSGNTGYNITHVNKGLAFESALVDGLLLLGEGRVTSLLVGSIEEISDYNYNIDKLTGLFKDEEVTSENLLTSGSRGTVCGEGAAMFVVEGKPSDRAQAQIKDVDQLSFVSPESMTHRIGLFLARNGLSLSEVDAILLGRNGDSRSDHWYDALEAMASETTGCYTFKNLVGEYPTASSFATWLAVQLVLDQPVPAAACWRPTQRRIKNILIYNHYREVQHGFILIKAVS